MPALSYHANVHNTALVILQRRGYRLWTEGDTYRAEKDGWDFLADDPVQLLGLVGIFEDRQPARYREYWWKIDEPRLLTELPTTEPDFTPVWSKK
jgi:hypothetical protein